MAHLKLRAPDHLPPHGLTLQQFKPWKNHLKNYLQQDADNLLFFLRKIYASWRAQEAADDRIGALHAQDPEAARNRERPNIQNAQLERDLAELLEHRNAQLAKFVSLITILCHYTKQDQVDQRATSLDWIFTFLEQKYNLSNKGTNFLKIGNIAYTPGTPHDAFYKVLRSAINDSLLKEGDLLPHWDNVALDEDERFSPTLENVFVLWALQLIDARLPSHVHKVFGHQLKDNTRLVDLQQQIFDQIPELLQDIEVAETNRAPALNAGPPTDPEIKLNAAFTRRGSFHAADCAIEQFLEDIPSDIQLMASCVPPEDITSLFFQLTSPCLKAATGATMADWISGPGVIPIGSKETWKALQRQDSDTKCVIHMITTGDSPRKSTMGTAVNRFFRHAILEDDLLVVKAYDPKLLGRPAES